MANLSNIFDEYEAERIAAANTPEALERDRLQSERAAIRYREEFEKGVRLGWYDEDGNSLLPEDEEDEEEAE